MSVGRLSLVIVDKDEFYIESMVEFIMGGYSEKVSVNSFTKIELLKKYLDDLYQSIDVLLINADLYNEALSLNKVKLLLILSGSNTSTHENLTVIKKYQNCEVIINQIQDLFAAMDRNSSEQDEKMIKIIAVYSPIGGVGKTTIAIALSNTLVSRGNLVLYLNIEDMSSTGAFLNDRKITGSISSEARIYTNKTNLYMGIDNVRSVDEVTGIHYLNFANSELVSGNIDDEEVERFINVFRETKLYDVLIIDLGSRFDKRAKTILENSDKVVLILGQDKISLYKSKHFFNGLIESKVNVDIQNKDKFIKVLNKSYSDDINNDTTRGYDINIPYIRELQFADNIKEVISEQNVFSNKIEEIADFVKNINE
jgi:cellulose biosynthesis protein BcsQ